jgi:hypothetical protein
MSTLVYHWAPCGYTSPANSLPLPLLHKFLVLIWLSICFPFAAPKSSPGDHACALHGQEVLLLRLYCSTFTIPVQALLSDHALIITPSIKCDNQFTCFNPTYHPVEQWLELRSGYLAGNIVTRNQMFDPEKLASLLFDACAAIDKLSGGIGCGLWGPGLGKDLYIK